MKKWLLGIGALTLSFSLAACNSEDSSAKEDKAKEEKTATKTEEKTEDKTTAKKDSSTEEKYKFSNESGDFTMLAGYTNDQSDKEQGFITLDFQGFTLKFMPVLVELKLSDTMKQEEEYSGKDTVRAIMVSTEAENTADHDVDYNGDITVITDTKEQLTADSGLLSNNPIVKTYKGKVKEEGYFLIPLKDQKSTPKELELRFTPPYKVENGAVNTDTGLMGKEQTVKVKYTSRESL
ncbi:hypothetical protein ACFTRE_07645 [Bacillus subtilis]|uniref:hypothetical protein n=1 Tax=Bacillus subtilis TaxID=1423 RepID=UPI00059CAD08|nr:hypothetical protein [Bacillus subtilis]KIN29807.1 hypothetical protein B4070_2891 [Bacillus subtilis]